MTSESASMSSACNISESPSNPLPTPTACAAPQYSAKAVSKFFTSLPSIDWPLSSTLASPASIAVRDSAIMRLVLKNGTSILDRRLSDRWRILPEVLQKFLVVSKIVGFAKSIGRQHKTHRADKKIIDQPPSAWHQVKTQIGTIQSDRGRASAVVQMKIEASRQRKKYLMKGLVGVSSPVSTARYIVDVVHARNLEWHMASPLDCGQIAAIVDNLRHLDQPPSFRLVLRRQGLHTDRLHAQTGRLRYRNAVLQPRYLAIK